MGDVFWFPLLTEFIWRTATALHKFTQKLKKKIFFGKAALMFEYICAYSLVMHVDFLTTRDATFVKALYGDWNQDEIAFAYYCKWKDTRPPEIKSF